MIVDIGGGTTEVAIISLRNVVYSKSLRVAGDEMDNAIINYMKRAYNLMIGERTAEEIKITVGSAFTLDQELTMEVRGRDSVAGLPKTLLITSQEIRECLSDTFNSIIEVVRSALERCPPELSADLVDRGIVLAGGGSLVRNLDRLLSEATGLPVILSDDPLSAVANGTGIVLQDLDEWLAESKNFAWTDRRRLRLNFFCGPVPPWPRPRASRFRPLLVLALFLAAWWLAPVAVRSFSRDQFFPL